MPSTVTALGLWYFASILSCPFLPFIDSQVPRCCCSILIYCFDVESEIGLFEEALLKARACSSRTFQWARTRSNTSSFLPCTLRACSTWNRPTVSSLLLAHRHGRIRSPILCSGYLGGHNMAQAEAARASPPVQSMATCCLAKNSSVPCTDCCTSFQARR